MNDIPAMLREPQGEEDTPEKLEAERQAAQEFINNGTSSIRYVGYLDLPRPQLKP